MRDNGFPLDRSPVLQVLDGFENKDALLNQTFRKKPQSLKEARAKEHADDDALKVYTERAWPECDVIVSNPPFLGNRFAIGELGENYVRGLFENYGKRLGGKPDLCCYWFEKARELIVEKKCRRAGLLATQGIRGGTNRNVLKNILDSGNIFFAESDRQWILDGANVHVSMVGFDDGAEKENTLDGKKVSAINANLTAAADTTLAVQLKQNAGVSFQGAIKRGAFDIPNELAMEFLSASGNPTGQPNSDVLFPYVNGMDVTRRNRGVWIIDFGARKQTEASRYEKPFSHIDKDVRPERLKTNQQKARDEWWLHWCPRPEMNEALKGLSRFIAVPRVSKHRLFAWLKLPCYVDCQLVIFARDDDYFFGVVHSRLHEVWALAQGTQLREKESGFRYTPTTCFETFPFPRPTPEQEAAIAAAAKELNDLRERWLNPPEWTVERVLEFPGSVNGPWAKYVVANSVVGAVCNRDRSGLKTPPTEAGVGLIRYPRLEPKDADCAARLKKRTLTNLYNERPTWLDLAHKKLDQAVAAAYGFPADLTDDQILERLLKLNLERAAEEAKSAQIKKPKTSRGKREDEMI